MSRLPSFVIKSYERKLMLSNSLLRKLKGQRLLVAMHLNDPTFKQQNMFRAAMRKKSPEAGTLLPVSSDRFIAC
jgi:hypothetical protein